MRPWACGTVCNPVICMIFRAHVGLKVVPAIILAAAMTGKIPMSCSSEHVDTTASSSLFLVFLFFYGFLFNYYRYSLFYVIRNFFLWLLQ